MTKILTSIFLGTLITIGSAAIAAGIAADPVVGTWKLNVAKSKFITGAACFAFGGICAAVYAFSQGDTVPLDNQF